MPHQSTELNSRTQAKSTRFLAGLLCLFVFAGFQIGAADTPREESKPSVGPPANWLSQFYFRRIPSVMKPEPGEDQHLILLERQVNAAEDEAFTHVIRQVLTPTGVQNGATLSIDFDPTYQFLVYQWVRILRGTNTLNALDLARVKLIQREQKLEEQIYNGRQSSVLVLEDVRVGDTLDYAYTIRGANPVMAGKFSGAVEVRLDKPVENLVTRVLWPDNRRLFARNHGGAVQPSVSKTNGLTVYIWAFRQVPPLHIETGLPVWYDPQPWVQLSEFQTWGEVNRWAMDLFKENGSMSPELTQKIAQWKQITDREIQVLAVLRFVQEEVRYFGIEIGASSHQASGSSVVFGRRFGDCKDKSQLFVTALRALGIEAYPVLVNTVARRTIQDWQPTPMAFDHVIAAVRLGESIYWLDPTANYQRGPLAAHELPNYGTGLVVQPKTVALTPIPGSTTPGEIRITEYFKLRGKSDPADLKVVTIATGMNADRLRALFATTPRSEIEQEFLQHYMQFYLGAKKAQAVGIADDELQNRFEVTETYTIDRIWGQRDQNGQTQCRFFPSSIRELLARPVESERTMPLGLKYPCHEIWRTEVNLPEAWPQDSKNKTVSDPAFFLKVNQRSYNGRLELEYDYRALGDSVAANRYSEYLKRLEDANQWLGYQIRW